MRTKKKRGDVLRLFLGLILTAAILTLGVMAVASIVMPLLERRWGETAVPDLSGMTQPQAEKALARVGLRTGSVRSVYSATVTRDAVVNQYPRAGRRTKQGRAVDLDISGGTSRLSMPDVIGLPTASAMLSLEQSGLVVARIESLRTPRVPADQVVNVFPSVGTEVTPGTQVAIVISTKTGTFPMPSLVGIASGAATGILKSQGLLLGGIQNAESSEPPGTVLFQYPEEGMPVVQGDTVSLIVAGKPPKPKR